MVFKVWCWIVFHKEPAGRLEGGFVPAFHHGIEGVHTIELEHARTVVTIRYPWNQVHKFDLKCAWRLSIFENR